jgi:hypothetical protein
MAKNQTQKGPVFPGPVGMAKCLGMGTGIPVRLVVKFQAGTIVGSDVILC